MITGIMGAKSILDLLHLNGTETISKVTSVRNFLLAILLGLFMSFPRLTLAQTAVTGTPTSVSTVTFSANPTFDALAASTVILTLTGNVISSRVTNAVSGQRLNFLIRQDSNGKHAFAWPKSFVNPPTVNLAPSATTNVSFIYDGTSWQNFGDQTSQYFKGPSPAIDVTAYGAVGDSVTDDGPAIQAAIDAACQNNSNGGGTVRFPTPPVNYRVATTIVINPAVCDQLLLQGEPGPRPGGISQFARAPRVRIEGPAAPLFRIDNSRAGGDVYYTMENLDIFSIGGMAIHNTDVSFFLLKNVGLSYNYDPLVKNSAALLVDGSTLWFKAEDSNFVTANHNTGPFHPAPGKDYDPSSWAPAALLIYGNSTHDGSILFNFDNCTWAHGGVKLIAADNAAKATGQTFGEMIFNMNVIEGQFASPMLQFENRQTYPHQGATMARVTVIESQQADVGHPTPFISAYGADADNTASVGSVFFIHTLTHGCLVQGINGHENIAGVWTDAPSTAHYVCDQYSLPKVDGGWIRHTSNGLDIFAPAAGPQTYLSTSNDAAVRTFIPDGVHANPAATSMLDTDGSLYLGPGGTHPFDLQLHRTSEGTYAIAAPVTTPEHFAAAPAPGGTFPDGTYYLKIAAGDHNNSPFTVSAASPEIRVVLGGVNHSISTTWTVSPANPNNKYTIYVGTTPGGENKAGNITSVGGPVTLSSMPNPNRAPSEIGTLLTDIFTITPDGFKSTLGGPKTGSFGGTLTGNRTYTMPDASGTVSLTQLYDCGIAAGASCTINATPRTIIGSAPLTSGTPSNVTITGINPAFTSSSSYKCALSEETDAKRDQLKITYSSGSSFTITGPDGTTDTIGYVCSGY